MKIIYTLLFGFMILGLEAQTELQIEIRDLETSDPISFATVRIEGSQRGFVADYFGQFRYPVSKISETPFLVLNSLGYQPLEIDLRLLESDILNIIYLNPKIETLDEVILSVSNKNERNKDQLKSVLKYSKEVTAFELVYKAVNSITKNLPNHPHSSIGYYRDYQFADSRYYNLNEGILEQFDGGIKTHKILDSLNRGAFYSFNINKSFPVNSQFTEAYNGKTKFIQGGEISSFGGNELSILNVHNPIRNFDQNSFSFVYHLNNEFLKNHKFQKDKVFFIADDPIIIITFTNDQEETRLGYNVKGTIILSLMDFSIYGFNYSVYDSDPTNPVFTVNIEYNRYKDHMYLNYISFNNRFVVADRNIFKESKIVYEPSNKNFEIVFNSKIDQEAVKNRNFKIKYKNKRIKITDFRFDNDSTIRLYIADKHGLLANSGKEELKNLFFLIEDLKDVNGREIYKTTRKIIYQFREYFVQENFASKGLVTTLSFIDKQKPLQFSKINAVETKNEYILNTPLRNSKVD